MRWYQGREVVYKTRNGDAKCVLLRMRKEQQSIPARMRSISLDAELLDALCVCVCACVLALVHQWLGLLDAVPYLASTTRSTWLRNSWVGFVSQ